MCHKCYNGFLAALILGFTFWKTSYSWWVVVIAAGFILVISIYKLMKEGCSSNLGCGSCGSKTGSKLIMEKTSEEVNPEVTEKEIRETLKKKRK